MLWESIVHGRKEFAGTLRGSRFVAGNIGAHLSQTGCARYALFEGRDGWR